MLIPTISKAGLFHVGTLQLEDKKAASFEGEGLSVSPCPDSWRAIARIVGDTWKIDKALNFLDAHALKDNQKSEIIQWANIRGFISQATLYRVEWFDDEMGQTMSTLFKSKEEATEEAEDMGVDFIPVDDYLATEVFPDATVRAGMNSIEFMDILLTAYAKVEHPEIDGVWWNDKHDVNRYSAPRGVVHCSKVSEVSFERI